MNSSRLGAFVIFASLALAGHKALAESNTYCDDKCGDSKACQYTCCTITTNPTYGTISNINCSSSICCAHPTPGALGNIFSLPRKIEGASGPVKWAIVGLKDAAKIAVESDDKARTVTLSGTVRNADERDLVDATVKRQAKGFAVVNHLQIVK